MINVGTQVINEKARKYIGQIIDTDRVSYGPFLRKFELDKIISVFKTKIFA